MAASGPGSTGDIQAVHRVAEILRLFTVARPSVTVGEAAMHTGLNRSTAHRYFGSLLADNILERSKQEPNTFVPGPLLVQLGAVAQGQRRVLDIAPRHLRGLSLETKLTAVLSVWAEAGPVVALVSEAGTQPILMTVRVGSTLDTDAAQTRLFAAFLRDRGSVERCLVRCTKAQREQFHRQMPGCRATALCRNDLSTIDASIVAAPVFDADDITATVGVAGTTSMLTTDHSACERALLRTARALTADLGGTGRWAAEVGNGSPGRGVPG